MELEEKEEEVEEKEEEVEEKKVEDKEEEEEGEVTHRYQAFRRNDELNFYDTSQI